MLTADDVEAAMVAACRSQVNGESFRWDRVALLLNERLADRREPALGDRKLLDWGRR